MFCLRFFEMYENKQMKRDALNRPTGPHTPSRNHLKSSMHPTFQGLPKPFLGCVDGHGCEQSFSSFSQKIIISNYLGPIFRWVRETWKFYEVFPGKQESGFPPAGRGAHVGASQRKNEPTKNERAKTRARTRVYRTFLSIKTAIRRFYWGVTLPCVHR